MKKLPMTFFQATLFGALIFLIVVCTANAGSAKPPEDIEAKIHQCEMDAYYVVSGGWGRYHDQPLKFHYPTAEQIPALEAMGKRGESPGGGYYWITLGSSDDVKQNWEQKVTEGWHAMDKALKERGKPAQEPNWEGEMYNYYVACRNSIKREPMRHDSGLDILRVQSEPGLKMPQCAERAGKVCEACLRGR